MRSRLLTFACGLVAAGILVLLGTGLVVTVMYLTGIDDVFFATLLALLGVPMVLGLCGVTYVLGEIVLDFLGN
jgi:hypothetical protein